MPFALRVDPVGIALPCGRALSIRLVATAGSMWPQR